MSDKTTQTNEHTDADIERVLGAVLPRQRPPADVQQRVYDATLAQWEAAPRATGAVRRAGPVTTWLALAATVAAVAVGTMLALRTTNDLPQPLGTIAFATGAYSIKGGVDGAIRGVDAQRMLVAGASVSTSPQGRVFIELQPGTTVRLDGATQATLRADQTIFLHHGRLYVDSHDSATDISVATPHAHITKVGTQFEVVASADELAVAVREGKVSVAVRGATLAAGAERGVGELLQFAGSRMVSREALAVSDDRWQWTQESRPLFDLSAHTLYDYLEWYARENAKVLQITPMAKRLAQGHAMGGGQANATAADLVDALASAENKLVAVAGAPYELIIRLPHSS